MCVRICTCEHELKTYIILSYSSRRERDRERERERERESESVTGYPKGGEGGGGERK